MIEDKVDFFNLRKIQSIGNIFDKVSSVVKFLQTKPQVIGMNFEMLLCIILLKKNRNGREVVNDYDKIYDKIVMPLFLPRDDIFAKMILG